MTDDDVDILMKYQETFGEPFLFNRLPDDEQEEPVQIAQACIDRGKPYGRWIDQEEGVY